MVHKLFSISALLLLGSAMLVAGGEKGTIIGVISGAHCGINGMECPPAHDLTRAEVPGIFADNNKFYFFSNVPQNYIAQWAFKPVKVEGKVYQEARAVDAVHISIKENGAWKTVFDDGNIFDPMGHKVKLADAVIIEGKWYCGKCAAMKKK